MSNISTTVGKNPHMGCRSIPSQFGGFSWLGSNAQALLKAVIDDHVSAERKKALAQSLSKSLVMFEMSKIPMFICLLHSSSLTLNVP